MNLLNHFNLMPHICTTTALNSKFGKLTILAIGKKEKTYRYYGVCKCECGKLCSVRLDMILSGNTFSCGCLHKEKITTHGNTNHPLYHRWRNMLDRCANPNNKKFKNYGGRGISVCERWTDLKNFIEDMENGFMPQLQLERKDNNGNYCPENCIWATRAEQQRNKRNNILVTLNGETKVLQDWCTQLGVKYQLAWERITVQGWDAETALTTAPIPAGVTLKKISLI